MYNRNMFDKDFVNLSEETIESLKYSCLDESTKIIKHLNPLIKENQEKVDNQIKIIENIAENA